MSGMAPPPPRSLARPPGVPGVASRREGARDDSSQSHGVRRTYWRVARTRRSEHGAQLARARAAKHCSCDACRRTEHRPPGKLICPIVSWQHRIRRKNQARHVLNVGCDSRWPPSGSERSREPNVSNGAARAPRCARHRAHAIGSAIRSRHLTRLPPILPQPIEALIDDKAWCVAHQNARHAGFAKAVDAARSDS
jgi:hypothetical protein